MLNVDISFLLKAKLAGGIYKGRATEAVLPHKSSIALIWRDRPNLLAISVNKEQYNTYSLIVHRIRH